MLLLILFSGHTSNSATSAWVVMRSSFAAQHLADDPQLIGPMWLGLPAVVIKQLLLMHNVQQPLLRPFL